MTDSTYDTVVLYAGSNGEVGIGTSSPSSVLDVVGNAEINGNITVTGTVDGRDVATDGSKLDGVESGATADQSAAEILTAIKTVDGSGTGLDADLLDGYTSRDFSGYVDNVADIKAIGGQNLYTFFSSSASPVNGPTGATWIQGIQFASAYNPAYRQILASPGNSDLYFISQGAGTWGSWNKLWHTGNDGSTSGLAAQTAATATALAADPTDCGGGQYATAIDASGNLTCATPAGTSEATVEGYIANDVNTNYVPRDNGTKLVTGSIFDDGTGVGIGTTSPDEELHVVGSAEFGSKVDDQFVTVDGIGTNKDFGYNIRSSKIFTNTSWSGTLKVQAWDKLEFETNADTSPVSAMTILDSGNVGIGSISPTSALHVNASAGDGGVKIDNTDSTDALMISGGGAIPGTGKIYWDGATGELVISVN